MYKLYKIDYTTTSDSYVVIEKIHHSQNKIQRHVRYKQNDEYTNTRR